MEWGQKTREERKGTKKRRKKDKKEEKEREKTRKEQPWKIEDKWKEVLEKRKGQKVKKVKVWVTVNCCWWQHFVRSNLSSPSCILRCIILLFPSLNNSHSLWPFFIQKKTIEWERRKERPSRMFSLWTRLVPRSINVRMSPEERKRKRERGRESLLRICLSASIIGLVGASRCKHTTGWFWHETSCCTNDN